MLEWRTLSLFFFPWKAIGNSHSVLVCISDFAFLAIEKLLSDCQSCFACDIKTNNAIIWSQ